MSVPAALALAVLLCVLTGAGGRLALDLAWRPLPPVLRVAAPVTGTAIIAAQLTLYGVAHVPWNALTLLVPWLAVFVAGRRRLATALRSDLQGVRRVWREAVADRLAATLITGCGAGAALMLFRLATQPLTSNDAIALWMFKAKVYYSLGRVDLVTVTADSGRHLDYPPLFSLAAATIHVLHGGIADDLAKVAAMPFVLTGAGVMLVTARSFLSTRVAAAATLLLLAMPLFANQLLVQDEMGYADVPLAMLMLASVACLVLAVREKGIGLAYGAVGLAGLAALTKDEGQLFLVMVVVVAAALVARRRPGLQLRLAAVAALPLLALLGWKLYTAAHGFSSDIVAGAHPSAGQLPARAGMILLFAVNSASIRSDTGWLVIAFLLGLELVILRRSRAGGLVLAVIVGQATGYFAAYLFTPLDLLFHLSTSFDRLVLQLAPLVLMVLLLGLVTPANAIEAADAPSRADGEAQR